MIVMVSWIVLIEMESWKAMTSTRAGRLFALVCCSNKDMGRSCMLCCRMHVVLDFSIDDAIA